MSTRRFELDRIEERDGSVNIALTIFRAIPGTDVRVGANYQRTEAVFNSFWRYKDGQLMAVNNNREWAVFVERNDETDFVLEALRSHGYR